MRLKASGRAALIVAAGLCIGFSAPLQAQQITGQTQTATQQPVALGKPLKLNKYAKHRSRHSRRHVSRHSRKHHRSARRHTEHKKTEQTAAKAAEATKINAAEAMNANNTADTGKTAETAKVNDASRTQAAIANPSPVLTESIANARAQLLSPTTDGTPAPMQSATPPGPSTTFTPQPTEATAGTAQPAPATSEVVASDQVNDIDRSATDANASTKPTLASDATAKGPDKPASPSSANPTSVNSTLANPTLAMASLDTPAAATAHESPWAQTSLIGKIFIAFGGLLTLASAARMFIA